MRSEEQREFNVNLTSIPAGSIRMTWGNDRQAQWCGPALTTLLCGHSGHLIPSLESTASPASLQPPPKGWASTGAQRWVSKAVPESLVLKPCLGSTLADLAFKVSNLSSAKCPTSFTRRAWRQVGCMNTSHWISLLSSLFTVQLPCNHPLQNISQEKWDTWATREEISPQEEILGNFFKMLRVCMLQLKIWHTATKKKKFLPAATERPHMRQ